jgi:hypothetical protein
VRGARIAANSAKLPELMDRTKEADPLRSSSSLMDGESSQRAQWSKSML